MAKRGRPTILTKTLIGQFERTLKQVFYLETVCDCLGVGESTMGTWRTRGKEAAIKQDKGEELTEYEELCLEFLVAIKKAASVAERSLLNRILTDEAWQSAAWMLERRYPKKWGKHTADIQTVLDELRKLRDDAQRTAGTA